MKMKTHFIFNRVSGTIVHVHISDEGQDISKEGILHKLISLHNKSEFDVHTVDELVEPGRYKIDVEKKSLVREDSNAKTASAFAGVKRPGIEGASKKAKTVYSKG
jgi:hypothetical protein